MRSRYPEPAESLWPLFNEYFGHVLSMSPYFNEKIGMRVGFEVAGQGIGRGLPPRLRGRFSQHGRLSICLALRIMLAGAYSGQGTIPWEDFFLLAVSGLAAPGRLQRSPSRSSHLPGPKL